MGVVNGVGDFAASFIVGVLWTATRPEWGFAYASVVGLLGVYFNGARAPQKDTFSMSSNPVTELMSFDSKTTSQRLLCPQER